MATVDVTVFVGRAGEQHFAVEGLPTMVVRGPARNAAGELVDGNLTTSYVLGWPRDVEGTGPVVSTIALDAIGS